MDRTGINLGFVLMDFAPPVLAYFMGDQRQKIHEGGCVGNCLVSCCCGPCVLCQNAVESEAVTGFNDMFRM